MSKRKKIIISLVVIILGTGILYFFLRGGGGADGGSIFSGFPFGTPPEGVPVGSGGEGEGGETLGTPGKELLRFVKLVETPVAGAVAFIKNGSTFVRYVDRATGHIYDINPATLEKVTILNTTLPKVYQAIWKQDASGFIMRSVADQSDVMTNVAIVLTPPNASSTDGLYKAQTTLLRGEIGDIVVIPDDRLLYNLNSSGSVSMASFTGEKPQTLYTSTFTEWRLHPINTSVALLVTKASVSALGYAYTLNLKSGGLTKVLGPLQALTILPNQDGKRLAYAWLENGDLRFSTLNLSTKSVLPVTPVTLPEKCVWSKKISSIIICGAPSSGLGVNVPDLWYRGEMAYTDNVWRFNTDTDTAEILVEPKEDFKVELDVTSPILSPDEDYLFFINKSDLSLWALRLGL